MNKTKRVNPRAGWMPRLATYVEPKVVSWIRKKAERKGVAGLLREWIYEKYDAAPASEKEEAQS